MDRWQDRLEFSNPGTLLLSREQLLRGGVSECRNKSLQLMFQMLGAGDKAGSGIDKIRASWADAHWQSPVLRESHRPDRVVLELPMLSVLPDEVLAILRGRFGAAFEALSGDEVQALVTAQMEGTVTNLRLQGMLTLHRVDITRMLRSLVQQGLLASDGVGRGTRYALPAMEGEAVGDPASPVSTSASPVRLPASPVSEAASPVSGVASQIESDYPDVVRRTIAAQRVKPAQMRQAILAVCADRFLSAQEIASILQRGRKRLQDEFLRPMCAEGVLTMLHPETPNHKQQAYRALVLARSEEAR